MVLTSGMVDRRFGPLMASALTLPAWISGNAEAVAENATWMTPPARSVLAAADDLYGTWRIFTPVCCLSASMLRWPPEPLPHEP